MENNGGMPADGALVALNEFATVAVEKVEGNPALLVVRDLRRGRFVVLDPLELEAITRMSREDLRFIADPSSPGAARMRDPDNYFQGMVGDDEMQIDGISG